MRRRIGGFAGALALVFAAGIGGLATSPGTAAAATPIVLGSCATTVQGTPGQPVSLSPGAVVAPVVSVVNAIPLLGPPLVAPLRSAFLALPPIPIGAVQTGTSTISGGTIANAVVAQLRNLPLLGPVLGTVVSGVQSTLAGMCGVTVKSLNAAAEPVQDGASAIEQQSQEAQRQLGILPGQAPGTGGGGTGGGSQTGPGGGAGGIPQTPGTGGAQGNTIPPNMGVGGGYQGGGGVQLYDPSTFGYNFGRSPMADYASLPFARPGVFAPSPGVRYGGSVPGYSPQFGILGTDGVQDGVQAAGNAESLALPSGDTIALPVLLAVLALSGVTAALVRTWVLRRTITV